ncbi:hypothetical protein KXQ82_14725 [Mucilaginibacter sp. HMF5004]|uniref:hypothetical protein n=1 Tax=Mucilaginibacter rivuli TaxID=2857527 RepID=UPI001C5D6B85|nr:hypothetical protein [Mucilaginibacter rivuli]MBW4890979.1 hypothetical protein [Mucilaginibacter rivuli]
MKKAILILVLAGIAGFAKAQKVQAPQNGYWVVESNKHTPKQSIVKFYNLDNVLIHQENVSGKKVKVNNNRTRQALNNTLQLALNGKLQNEPILAMELSK